MLRGLITAMIAGAGAPGCGLIDIEVADLDLSMPERSFTIDTAQWELTGDSTFPSIDCANQPQICSAAVVQVCGGALCFGSCGGASCEALLALQLWSTVDLFGEKPELQAIGERTLATVEIDRVYYEVAENTLNIDTPELTVYVAPSTVMSPGDPSAEAVGTIAPMIAGETVAETDMLFVATGETTLNEVLKAFQTPFNLLVGAQLTVHGGDPVPTGRAIATVNVRAHASL